MQFINEWPPKEEVESEAPKCKKLRTDSVFHVEDLVGVEPLIASWWRKYGKSLSSLGTVSNSPHVRIRAMLRREECQDFIRSLESRLKLSNKIVDKYTLLTLYRLQGRDSDAFTLCQSLLKERSLRLLSSDSQANLEYIKALRPFDKEILRVSTLAQLQNDFAIQCAKGGGVRLPKRPLEVQVFQAKDLTLQDFKEKFAKAKKPVIIEGLELTKHFWSFEFLKKVAGHRSVQLRYSKRDSTEWARLETSSSKISVKEFIESIESGKETEGYLFDWSLPMNSQELLADFSIPFYFEVCDYLKRVDCSLYKRSWPSLFISPKGTVSDLHIDAFASNFWMALLSGSKKWTFFSPESTPYLRPRYFDTFDPVFDIDWQHSVLLFNFWKTSSHMLFITYVLPSA